MEQETLKSKALALYAKGLTVVPFYGIDMFEWRDCRNVSQKQIDVEKMNWEKAIGISIVAGSYKVNDIKVYKFHKGSHYTVTEYKVILKALSLPEDYLWAIPSTDKKSIEVFVRGEYLQGVSFITGNWRRQRVHIVMEGRVYIPRDFEIPETQIKEITVEAANRFLHLLDDIHGLRKDENGHYIYYK